MIMNHKTKKVYKLLGFVFILMVLTGCTSNVDENGVLLAERAINNSTEWSMSAGWFDFLFVIPISKTIIYISEHIGNIAVGVVLVTVLINLLILPIMIKSTTSSQKIQLIQPEIQDIQRKYKGRKDQASQMRMSQEIQNLYKKHDVSMFSSFSTFLTLPIMLAMYQAVQRIEILYNASLFGIKLGDKPMDHIFTMDIGYILLVLAVGVFQFYAMRITTIMAKRNPRYRETAMTRQMNTTNYFMTAMIVYFAAIMPAAMSLYWITTSIIGIARTVYIQFHHVEKKRK